MKDRFFELENCERCGKRLQSRIMSWFTEETICWSCSKTEKDILKKLKDSGDTKSYEGCGYIPKI